MPYKFSESETLESLELRKKEVVNQIVNGQNLDALAMDALYKKLKSITDKINEKREEVANDQ